MTNNNCEEKQGEIQPSTNPQQCSSSSSSSPSPSHSTPASATVDFPLESWRLPAYVQRSGRKDDVEAELASQATGSQDSFHRLIISSTTSSYNGDICNGLYDGSGHAEFKSGQTYDGEFIRGIMAGEGKYVWPDGTTYTGTMIGNSVTGHGRIVWPDGSHYEGDVLDGFRHGNGVFIHDKHNVSYDGEWKHGARHGKGKLCYNLDGSSYYAGSWCDGRRDGAGVLVYAGGNTYSGQWKHDRKQGQGIMHWKNKQQIYDGQWDNDLPHGKGDYTWYDLPRGAANFSSHFPLSNRYVGDFVRGVRDGEGSMFYAAGASYTGQWCNNEKHGFGQYSHELGARYTGPFEHDKMSDPVLAALFQHQCKRIHMQIHDIVKGVESDRWRGSNNQNIQQCIEQEHTALHTLVLRFNSELLDIYRYYSQLEVDFAEPPTAAMSIIALQATTTHLTLSQFWLLLNDLQLSSVPDLSLATIDRLAAHQLLFDPQFPHHKLVQLRSIHDGRRILLFTQFVEALVRISALMYSCTNASIDVDEQSTSADDSDEGGQTNPNNLMAEANANFNQLILGPSFNAFSSPLHSTSSSNLALPIPLNLSGVASPSHIRAPAAPSSSLSGNLSTTAALTQTLANCSIKYEPPTPSISACFKRFIMEVVLPRAKCKSKNANAPASSNNSSNTSLSSLLSRTPIYRLPSLLQIAQRYFAQLEELFIAESNPHHSLPAVGSVGRYRYPLDDRTLSLRGLLKIMKARNLLTQQFTMYHVLDALFGAKSHGDDGLHQLLDTELILPEFIYLLIKLALYRAKIIDEANIAIATERAAKEEILTARQLARDLELQKEREKEHERELEFEREKEQQLAEASAQSVDKSKSKQGKPPLNIKSPTAKSTVTPAAAKLPLKSPVASGATPKANPAKTPTNKANKASPRTAPKPIKSNSNKKDKSKTNSAASSTVVSPAVTSREPSSLLPVSLLSSSSPSTCSPAPLCAATLLDMDDVSTAADVTTRPHVESGSLKRDVPMLSIDDTHNVHEHLTVWSTQLQQFFAILLQLPTPLKLPSIQ